jgi:hypothetical protein
MADWLTWESDVPGIAGGALTADVVKQITANADSDATEHPIESGSTISDHVIKRPKRVTFEFAQSSMPLNDPDETEWTQVPWNVRESQFKPRGLLALTMLAGQALAAIGAAVGIGGGAKEIWVLTAKEDKDRIHELHDTLIDVWDNAYLCTFNYQGLYLPDYVLTSVQYSRGVPGGIARFTLEAKAIVTVETAAAALSGAGGAAALPGAINLVPVLPKGPSAVEQIEKEVVRKSLLVQTGQYTGVIP